MSKNCGAYFDSIFPEINLVSRTIDNQTVIKSYPGFDVHAPQFPYPAISPAGF
jgi:hypothetical protein